MRIYTKTGDAGETGLFAGPRVRKDDPRIEAYGTIDELNAFLGLALAEDLPVNLGAVLLRIQGDLFSIGAELATPEPVRHGTQFISDEHIHWLESSIDEQEANLPPLDRFILPGGTRLAALLHVSRAVCRRAERRLVTFAADAVDSVSPHLLIYLNRLGDFLFVAARSVCHQAGIDEPTWERPS